MAPRHPDEDDPFIGLEIAHALRLEALIGLGTTGRVYRARQISLDSVVAVKVLHRFLMQTAGVKERFHREARLLARLVHPGIVRVLGSGELAIAPPETQGETYLIYEYLEGQTLRDVLRESGHLPVADALHVACHLAQALSIAHERQIVHRDLKPENVMSVARDNGEARYVILDFGLARALDGDSDPLTREGAILGTPQYMSPEAARGESTSAASDVYALATILYELIAGHPPFYGKSPILVLSQQANVPPPQFDAELDVPVEIAGFVHSNLGKSPNDRCANATGFAKDLTRLSEVYFSGSHP